METRVLSIGIRKYLVRQPRNKRARKATRYFRERIAHYTKIGIENVKIDRDLNSMIMKYYARHMTSIKASIKIDNGIATVSRFGEAKKPSGQSKPTSKGATSGKKPETPPVKKADEKNDKKPKGADRTENAKKSGESTKPKPASTA